MESSIPETRVVFPAPSSPVNAIQSPAATIDPRWRPNDLVSPSVRSSERSSTLTGSASGTQRGDGEDHLLERDAAVLEAPTVLALVLVELGGVDEIEVFLRDDVLLVERVRGKA